VAESNWIVTTNKPMAAFGYMPGHQSDKRDQQRDENQLPVAYDEIEVMRSYTLLEITYFDFKPPRFN
jgi:hypothetical protein